MSTTSTNSGPTLVCLPVRVSYDPSVRPSVDDTVHYFLLMVRNGAQVIVTQMVSTHDAVRGVLHFPNLIKLNDIMNDFRYELEVYAMVRLSLLWWHELRC